MGGGVLGNCQNRRKCQRLTIAFRQPGAPYPGKYNECAFSKYRCFHLFVRFTAFMKLPAVCALLSGRLFSCTLALAWVAVCPQTLTAQPVPHAKGVAHTAQVDIAYETFGSLGNS